MLEIKENQELNVTNLLSYRGKLKQTELENIGKEMESYIQSAGAKRVGNPITATYELEGDEIDIELLMPIDKSIESMDKFDFKNQIKIVNAVVASYIGHPMGVQDECINIDGGVAPFLIYTIVIAGGLAAGYVFGYFGG